MNDVYQPPYQITNSFHPYKFWTVDTRFKGSNGEFGNINIKIHTFYLWLRAVGQMVRNRVATAQLLKVLRYHLKTRNELAKCNT